MNKLVRQEWRWVAVLALGACHSGSLVGVSGNLSFSSPDQPSAVETLDGGLVRIDFGQVPVDSTKTLTLSVASLSNASVVLGAFNAIAPDSEFSLPFTPGTVIEPSPPIQISAAFSPTSVGGKSAVYSLAYTSPQNGTVTFELAGEGVLGAIGVSPNPVDFGQVELNQLQTVSLTLTNNAALAATITVSAITPSDGGANSSELSLGQPSSTALAPGATATLDATFGPLVTGPVSASFALSAAFAGGTASPPTSVNLSGTGVQSVLQVAPLDFGYLPPGETLVKAGLVTNAGSFTTLHLIAPAPHISAGGAAFALGPSVPGQPGQDAVPIAIAPGQTAQIPVAFAPATLGAYRGTLSLASDDPGSPTPVIPLSGNGGGPQILCLSPLDFGPVPLGFSGSLRTTCLNVGTDIPNDSDGGLRITQSGLIADSSAFVGSLILPDGGLAGPDDAVSLAAGKSTGISVTFRPSDAGLLQGRLLVESNDPGDADAGVRLAGEGLVPGVCSVTLVPSTLNFGEVPSEDTGFLSLAIENTGQNLCEVAGIRLDSKSDPSFSLPGGDLGVQLLSFPGNPDNPAHLPTSLYVEVEFAPVSASAAATGSVEVTVSNAAPAALSVPLSGNSAASCLTIEPQSWDFGLVGFNYANQQICAPDKKTFTAQNSCVTPVTLSAIDLAPGSDGAPQFELDSALQLPLTVAPGGAAYFQAGFAPTSTGPKLGSIAVSTSEYPTAPFLLTVQGDAETSGPRTDTFTVPAPGKKVDILWVLDTDDDMISLAKIQNALPQFIQALDSAQIDYQIAVTSTDTCDAGGSDQGFLEPCPHCKTTTSSDPEIITPSAAAPDLALSDRFQAFQNTQGYDCDPFSGVCTSLVCFNGDEHFFDSIALAFAPGVLSGHNAGFVRPDAYLAVMVVNGDVEDDAFGDPVFGPGTYPTDLDQVTTLLWDLKPDPSLVSVSYISPGDAFRGQPRMTSLVEATSGVEIDPDLTSWETMLVDLLPLNLGFSEFHLSSTPVGPIQVAIEGTPTTAWSYDSFTNDIVFPATNLPAAGSTITVTYEVGCQ